MRNLSRLHWTWLALCPFAVLACSPEPTPEEGDVSPASPLLGEASSPLVTSARSPIHGRIALKLERDLAASLRAHLTSGRAFSDFPFPEGLARLHRSYGVTAIRPMFGDAVSDTALRARIRELAATGRQVDPDTELPHLERIFVLDIDARESPTRAAAHYGILREAEYAEPFFRGELAATTPPDPLFTGQWAPRLIDAPGAWDFATGAGQTIAILDSGIDGTHPDLASQVDPNMYEACTGSLVSPPYDTLGHGTHVAGIAGAEWSSSTGIAGMAPGATLVAVSVVDPGGAPRPVCVAEGLAYAASVATVANASLAMHATSHVIEDAVMAAHAADVLVAAAAGNDTSLAMAAPANVEWALAVGAVDDTDARATYSNTGVKLDVVAPGGANGVCSTPTCVLSSWPPSLPPYSSWVELQGTSMASPHVAGLAALVREVAPSWSVEQVRSAIRLPARDANVGTLPGFDDEMGHGRVDAHRSVLMALAGVAPPTANITIPKNDQHIRGKTKIYGYSEVPAGATGTYDVEWATTPQGVYSPVSSGSLTGVAPGQVYLGMINTGALPGPGRYVLRLTTRDTTNNVVATDYNEIEACGGCAPRPAGAVAWWKFDRATFPVAKDSVGLNHGVYSGDAAPGPNGFVNDGAGFFGGNSDHMAAPAVSPPTFYTTSVHAWIRRGGAGPGIIAAYSPDGVHGWELGMYTTGAFYLATNIQGGGAPQVVSSVATAPFYEWTHVAAVVEPQIPGILAPMKITIYVNGNLDNQITFVMPSSWLPPATAASYRVGNAASIVPGNPASMPFGGNIDEVQVFGAPISASQIAATYAARCGGTCL